VEAKEIEILSLEEIGVVLARLDGHDL